MYYSIYITSSKQLNPQRHIAGLRWEFGQNGQQLPNGCEVSFWGGENVLELDRDRGSTNCSKLFTFKWLIFCLMNFSSTKRKAYKKRNEQDLIKFISNVKKGKALWDKNIKKMQKSSFMRNICLQLLIKGTPLSNFSSLRDPFFLPIYISNSDVVPSRLVLSFLYFLFPFI